MGSARFSLRQLLAFLFAGCVYLAVARNSVPVAFTWIERPPSWVLTQIGAWLVLSVLYYQWRLFAAMWVHAVLAVVLAGGFLVEGTSLTNFLLMVAWGCTFGTLLSFPVAILTIALRGLGVRSWIGSGLRRTRQNRGRLAPIEKAVLEIERMGGCVTSEYERRRPQTWPEMLFFDPGGPDDPVGVLIVSAVDLVGCGATDADLECVKLLANLEKLDLGGSHVTDAGLEHLSGLMNLQLLNVTKTKVTDAGIKKLKEALPNCQIIY